jgi:predicted nucleotidyltransferase
MEEAARRTAIAFARGIGEFWQRRLEARLLGAYVIGSLAHGGFSSRYSDIDMGVVAEGGLSPDDLAAMRAAAAALSPPHAAKLSLFWSDRAFAVWRFPPLDRVDYIDHAQPLVERERVLPPRPSRDDIRAYLRGQPFESWRDGSQKFAAAETLAPGDHKAYVRCLLYPARLMLSWATGRMASNDDAVAFLRSEAPAGLDVDLIERSLRCRQAGADPDGLFPERVKLPDQVAACARVVEGLPRSGK